MYQDVLIPTDGSDGTRRSLIHGLTIADRFDATVHGLSVIPEGPFGTLESETATSAAHRAVECVEAEASREGLEVFTAVDQGVPHEVILEYVDEHDVDMIVMGTQGRTGIDRVLVGSVTERIVRMADVPVVTVRLSETVRIDDPAEARRIAQREASQNGYQGAVVVDEPHRTSGSWVVPLEADSGPLQVHVDAVSGEPRVGSSDDDTSSS